MDDTYRQRLDDELASVRADLAGIDARLAETRSLRMTLHDDDEHDPDGVPLSEEWSLLEGLRSGVRIKLGELEHAKARLDAGLAGICVTCGGEIAPARMLARPGATTCIGCAA